MLAGSMSHLQGHHERGSEAPVDNDHAGTLPNQVVGNLVETGLHGAVEDSVAFRILSRIQEGAPLVFWKTFDHILQEEPPRSGVSSDWWTGG